MALRQVPEARGEIVCEVARPIAVDLRICYFDLIENGSYLICRHPRVGEVFVEAIKGFLEVDVVLPQSIISIENQKLALHVSLLPSRPWRDRSTGPHAWPAARAFGCLCSRAAP